MCGFLVTLDSQLDPQTFDKAFQSIKHRGPDDHQIVRTDQAVFGFHRLAIMDLTAHGNQPFQDKAAGQTLVCNGEIYNHRHIKTDYKDRYQFTSDSDCEVILPLIQEYGIEKTCKLLDGEYAFVLYDFKKGLVLAARDEMGIRPMFVGRSKKGHWSFASEAKALKPFCDDIKPFPPGHYFDGKEFIQFHSYDFLGPYQVSDREKAKQGIKKHLTAAVEKRLDSDAPIGFLLSGGLDSSLVCAIAAKLGQKPLRTFSVGIETDPIDTKYARIVADFIGSDHTEVLFKKEEAFTHLKELIGLLETYDVTTIRAAMGMFLVCKYIREKTDIKVVLTGEVSDEIFGYKYTDFAPSARDFQQEAVKRVKELYMYDVLRADRCIAGNSLEARVPFSDRIFVEYVMKIDPDLKMNTTGVGKHLLRQAFEEGDYLPHEILYREKAAFSDAVGHSLVDNYKAFAEAKYTQEEFESKAKAYSFATPYSKEALMYREIFEELFPKMAYLVSDFWMPNKLWKNCDVKDPSARVLPNYGKSGS